MERIAHALFGSRYSIHDLSRCTGQGSANLARFNMPLELGMAIAHQFLSAPGDKHSWLVLVPAGDGHSRFISDLAAYDLSRHDGSIEGVVSAVIKWLVTKPEAIPTMKPAIVLEHLPVFEVSLRELRTERGRQ